jgi:hypothetical protein
MSNSVVAASRATSGGGLANELIGIQGRKIADGDHGEKMPITPHGASDSGARSRWP